MYCTHCGQAIQEKANFCGHCGKAATPHAQTGFFTPKADRKLLRPVNDKWIAGVCAAFANYLNVDIALVRILWLGAAILFGTGLLAYVICWLVIPREQLNGAPVTG